MSKRETDTASANLKNKYTQVGFNFVPSWPEVAFDGVAKEANDRVKQVQCYIHPPDKTHSFPSSWNSGREKGCGIRLVNG